MEVDRLVAEIQDLEERRREEAMRILDGIGSREFSSVPENTFITPVDPGGAGDLAVTGVDGGLVRKEFHGMDVIINRAVAAVFQYADGKLGSADYLPSRNPSPDMEYVSGSTGRKESGQMASIRRLESEISTANEAVPETDLLLLDGSLAPRTRDRPDEDSELFDRYEDLLERYRELYRRSEDGDALLAGVVEDSRSSLLCSHLRQEGFESEVLDDGRDTVLLDYLMEPGERSFVVPYRGSGDSPVNDLELEGDLHLFYLRTSGRDSPVRIEFLSSDDPVTRAEEIAAIILGLCGTESSYGLPPVLVEADQRAKLSGNEVDILTKRLEARLAHHPGLEGLRRDRRPF